MKNLRLFAILLCSITTAYAEDGQVTKNLLTLFAGMNSIFSGICIIVGIGLVFASFIQYRQHKMNKLLVPISKPIMMFILGLVLIAIPILGHYTKGGQIVSQQEYSAI